MKFDVLLAQYLYEKKVMQLQGVGTFSFEGNISQASTNEKEVYYPIEGLSFQFNPKQETSEDLVLFLTQKLGKIQPLVRSDLESYLNNMNQFINIGKPYTIEGIGTLQKNNQGIYEFSPGNFLPEKEELNPTRENAEHNYHELSKGPNVGKIALYAIIIIAGLAALGGIGWGITKLFSNKKPDVPAISQPVTDTIQEQSRDTVPAIATVIPDSTNYKMIFEFTFNQARAQKRTAQLKNINAAYDSLLFNDSLQYRLYIPVTLKTNDTLMMKDSLRKYFNKTIYIEGN